MDTVIVAFESDSLCRKFRDLLEGSGAGYLVPFGDAAAFAETVQTLGRDAALRARMGAAANESTEKYALDRVLPEVLPHFTRH